MRDDLDVPMPSVRVIATEKARAFGRQIREDGIEAARKLGLLFKGDDQTVYATNGGSSSFKINDLTVHFKRVSLRKMSLGDTRVGLAVRALWQLGKAGCQFKDVQLATINFNRTDRQQFRQSRHLMPGWMTNFLRT
jgi:hypothetical protein